MTRYYLFVLYHRFLDLFSDLFLLFIFGTIGIGILIYSRNRELFIRVLWDLVFYYLFIFDDGFIFSI